MHMLLTLAMMAMMSHLGCCQLIALTSGSAYVTQVQLVYGQSQTLSFVPQNIGYPCQFVPCYQGDRFVMVSGQSQRYIIQISVSVSNASANINSGLNPGVTAMYGTWSPPDQCDGNCFTSDCGWSPAADETVMVTVTLIDPASIAAGSVEVQLAVVSRDTYPPVPGGCCDTCINPADPTLTLIPGGDNVMLLTFKQANLGLLPSYPIVISQHMCGCDAIAAETTATSSTVQYQLYQYFPTDCGSYYKRSLDASSYYQAMSRMSTVAGVKQYGVLVNAKPLLPNQPLRSMLLVNAGQGVVYNILATDVAQAALNPTLNIETFQSVYAPAGTYDCTFDDDGDLTNCEAPFNTFLLVALLLLAFLGIFIACLGHRFFGWQLLIYGILQSGYVFYVVLASMSDLNDTAMLAVSAVLGVVGGGLQWLLWYIFNLLTPALVLIGGSMGYLITCMVFATPIGNYTFFTNNFNFGMCMACGCLLFPIPLFFKARWLNLVSNGVVGAYYILMPVAFFFDTSFIQLVTNPINRALYPGYAQAYSGNYFGNEFNGCVNFTWNVAMVAAWLFLSIIFIVLEFWKLAPKGNNDVPHSPLYARGHPSVGRVIRDIYINVRNRTTRFGFAGGARGRGDHNEDDVPLLAAGEAVKDDDAIYEDPDLFTHRQLIPTALRVARNPIAQAE